MPEAVREPSATGRRKTSVARVTLVPGTGQFRINGRTLAQPHASRINLWARTVACCPHCQVEPGTPCHNNGRPLADVHPRRIQEAKETCA